MRPLHYIEITNFKLFGHEPQRIDLDHPTVLVGPNNCGKTTIIQAIAFWSHAVKVWYASKGQAPPKKRTATALNRLNIVSVPVRRTRYFWHDAAVRTGNIPIPIDITVGVLHANTICPVTITCRNQGEDIVYCAPDEATLENLDAIATAAAVDVHLLYSMSGLELEEPTVQPGRVNVLLGQGQTAQVLRNLCLMVRQSSSDDWEAITLLMGHLFDIELTDPLENSRGSIDLHYRQQGLAVPLEIASAGRGLQQILLILSYLYSHRSGVLLIDEPDAHLEILRQKQVYVLLREIAAENDSQVLIVTHSEQILDEAVDHSLTLLLGGRSIPVPGSSVSRDALKQYGTEHYLRARQRGYVLYLEGNTDLQILKSLAKRLDHPVAGSWDERANIYYVQDNYPERSLDAELARVEGAYGLPPERHFYTMREMVPGIRGLAILDADKGRHDPYEREGFRVSYWHRYEIENYIVTPLTLRLAAADEYDDGSFDILVADEVLEDLIAERIFSDATGLGVWQNADQTTRQFLWETSTKGVKLSDFAEEFFRRLATNLGRPMLMRKADLHRLVAFVDVAVVPAEVGEKLDLLDELFKSARGSEDS
ncbi:MAG: AAA family ATPase [Deltaproteobacteria bacterium]|nr:AAA family ATPase [Deltaproteobacteria bacterium]